MTDLMHDLETPGDAELISRVRGGDVAAYGELFSRHVDAASRLARQLVRSPDADDLVSEAFAKVLQVLQGGGGPDVAFRAYLLTAVRRLHVDKMRTLARVQPTDDLTPYDAGTEFEDPAVAGFESGAAARAFASLPERWQMVLWHLEVEGQKPADIAPLLGMSANSVSALAYRAREGLRQAFLQMHLADLAEDQCRWTHDHLGAYVRKGLSKRDNLKVREHLETCRPCTALYLELTEVNHNLAGLLGPLVLGGAATAYLSGGTATGSGAAAGVLTLLGRGRDLAGAHSAAAVGAGVAVTAAVGIAIGSVVLGGGPPPVAGDRPATQQVITAAPAEAAGDASPASRTTEPSPSGRRTPLGGAVPAPLDDPADPADPADPPTSDLAPDRGDSPAPEEPAEPRGSVPTKDPEVAGPTDPGREPTDRPSPTKGPTREPSNPPPTSNPPPPPTSNPPPPPPATQQDLRLSVSAAGEKPVADLAYTVSGLRAGQSTTLRVTVPRPARLVRADSPCTKTGGGVTCTVRAGDAPVVVRVKRDQREETAVTARLDPVDGAEDPQPADNTVVTTLAASRAE